MLKKSILNKILFFISGMAFFVMGAPANIWGMCICAILMVLLIYAVSLLNIESVLLNLKNKQGVKFYIVFSLAIGLLNGVFFFSRWQASSKVRWVAGLLNVQANALFTVLGGIGVLISLPFVLGMTIWFCEETVEESISRLSSFFSSRTFYIGCLLISFIGIVIQTFFCFSHDIWVDEAFSLAMIKHSYWEMINLTAMDVHPPLYYIILKLGVTICQCIFPKMSSIYVAKLISVMPFILLWIICVTKIRKQWGTFVSGMLTISLIGMPNLISYGVEIRMYSWALLFVSVVFFYAHDIVLVGEKKWCAFVLSSLAAAYTHYFACIAVAVVYLIMLVWLILKNRALLKNYFMAAVIVAAGYLPWLFLFITHGQTSVENFWKAEIGIHDIEDYFQFPFDNSAVFLCVGAVSVLLIAVLVQKKRVYGNTIYALAGIGIPVGTVLAGVMVSVLFRPVFISRYMFPCLICLWFGMLLGIQSLQSVHIKVYGTFVIYIVCFLNMALFIKTERDSLDHGKEAKLFFEETGDAIYIVDNDHVQGVVSEMSGGECYLWSTDISEISLMVYEHLGNIDSIQDLCQLVDSGKSVYYIECLGGFADTLPIEQALSESGLSYLHVGSKHMEYAVEIYQITENKQ